jgi:hypothetical protein
LRGSCNVWHGRECAVIVWWACMGSQVRWTPLLSACKEGHVEVVTMLLEHEADVNEVDMVGWERCGPMWPRCM